LNVRPETTTIMDAMSHYNTVAALTDHDFAEPNVTTLDLIRQAAAAIQRAIERREPVVMKALRRPERDRQA
jgi:hypothetical protein